MRSVSKNEYIRINNHRSHRVPNRRLSVFDHRTIGGHIGLGVLMGFSTIEP